ncbi:MAG: Crp/Fnr family transcriptional regulator [Myxococcaceae bacterium]|jgi:CRP-like cAMP-binding protein|nr:Crp/Fnr family transcriptional regulator [Myxococcaceae bacterium]
MLQNPVDTCRSCPLHAEGRCGFVPRRVRAGEVLWEQGEVPREVLFVKRGAVALTGRDSEGNHWWNGVRGPRAVLGIEALQSRPARAAARALSDGAVCASDPVVMRVQLGVDGGRGGALASAMVPLLLEELDRRSDEVASRSGPALVRVARFILEHHDVVESGKRGPFSKRHVASMLGIRPETMSRNLTALADAGVIRVEPDIEVLDRARLESFATPPRRPEPPKRKRGKAAQARVG